MTKAVQTFMTNEDERFFSEVLKQNFPALRFLDCNIWGQPEPLERARIDLCTSNYDLVYLWNSSLFPQLPVSRRPDGRYQGPASGPVVQFVRSIQEESVLRSGRVAVGFNKEDLTDEVTQFVNELWKILKRFGISRLICVRPATGELINPKVTGYLAWPNAVKWVQAQKGRFLRDRSTQNFYLPA